MKQRGENIRLFIRLNNSTFPRLHESRLSAVEARRPLLCTLYLVTVHLEEVYPMTQISRKRRKHCAQRVRVTVMRTTT